MATDAGASFAARLLRWFAAAQRDLPWRRTRDPWAIWVSEIMLQQTRVEAVREPFERFLARYPTPDAFAAADDDEVMVAWRGLGYYRRARLLRDGARRVTERHGGVVPDTVEALRDLPGVGPYTLGAVASIAFGRCQPAVDGNVERVLSRHLGLDEPIGTGRSRRAITEVVLARIDAARPGDFNQALMELGATVCTPTSPSCDRCPVAADCVARRDGRTAELPRRKAPRAAVEVSSRAVLARRGDRALGYRVPADQPNGGQVELPGPGVLRDCDPDDLEKALRERFGADVRVAEEVA
ncbi:MAG: A/G-specific adenine glycosylase, partial [Planctomycetes bacterium]|nr:A/G-specific adenine glycosylase [Planctomycetota bacterium]